MGSPTAVTAWPSPERRRPGRRRAATASGLGDRGVLVLVEEHHLELAPLDDAHVGLLDGQPGAELDLVGEVHQAQVALEPSVAGDQLEQLGAPVDREHRLLAGLAVALAVLAGDLGGELALEALRGPRRRRAHVGGVDEVLAHRAVEGEEVLDDGGRVVAEVLDVAGEAVDHAGAELVAGGVGDHPGVGLVADAQAVLGEQRRRRRRCRWRRSARSTPPRRPRPAVAGRARRGRSQRTGLHQGVEDLAAQLAGGLGGEGQPEHLVGPHLAGDDEVDHPGRHQRGLAGAGAGDHDGRRQRRRDRRPLLRARREVGAHDPLELLGRLDLGIWTRS